MRSPVNNRWVGVGAVALATLAAVFGLVAAAEAGRDQGSRGKEKVVDESYSLKRAGTLEIDVEDMDIEVRTGGSSGGTLEVFVSGPDQDRARQYFEEIHFEAQASGNRLIIESHEPRGGVSFWRRYQHVHTWAIITVPEEFSANVSTEDGDIRLESLKGDVHIDTEDGNIKVSNVTGSAVHVETEDGDITAGEIKADDVTLATEDGDLRAERIEGRRVDIASDDGDIEIDWIDADEIVMKTSDGDIEVGASGKSLMGRCSDGDIHVDLHSEMKIDLSADDGDISLTIPKGIGADLDLKGGSVSVSGGIAIDGSVSKRTIKGSVNKGGPRLRVRTSDGRIMIRQV